MIWQIYAIIVVLIIWGLHKIVLMGFDRINMLKQIFSEQGVPLVIDGGWTKGDVIKINYSNASSDIVVGFLIEIGISHVDGSDIELVEQFIDISSKPITPYKTKSLQLQVSNLDTKNKYISTISFKKVVFENNNNNNNKTWDRK